MSSIRKQLKIIMRDDTRIYHCPVCKGTGAFELPKNVQKRDLEIKRYLVKLLYRKGYGVRQIQRALGYRSPQSISLLLKSIRL